MKRITAIIISVFVFCAVSAVYAAEPLPPKPSATPTGTWLSVTPTPSDTPTPAPTGVPTEIPCIDVLYDDFDDDDISDWVECPKVFDTKSEVPGMFKGTIIGTNGTEPFTNYIVKPSVFNGTYGFSIEFRAIVGKKTGDYAAVYVLGSKSTCITTTNSHYGFRVHGEGVNQLELFYYTLGDGMVSLGSYAFSKINLWHTYRLSRDMAGKWTLYIDGIEHGASFTPDLTLNTFGYTGIELHTSDNNMDWIRVCIDDVHTPTPTATNTPIVIPTATPAPTIFAGFDLCSGLNLISLPFDSTATDTADELLNSICAGDADAMWYYDCTVPTFVSWTKLDPGSGWATWPGMPFWANITNLAGCSWNPTGALDTTISFPLCIGLNMVSLPVYSTSLTMASDMILDIPACTAVWKYNKSGGCANPPSFTGYFLLSTPADDFALTHGHGYWTSVTGAGTWVPPLP